MRDDSLAYRILQAMTPAIQESFEDPGDFIRRVNRALEEAGINYRYQIGDASGDIWVWSPKYD